MIKEGGFGGSGYFDIKTFQLRPFSAMAAMPKKNFVRLPCDRKTMKSWKAAERELNQICWSYELNLSSIIQSGLILVAYSIIS